jgi:prepilin-type N-terminal cleavage/methylation domain-containing protein
VNQRGMTFIELLVALAIVSFLMGGVYRLVISQVRAHTAQEEVADAQQGVRAAMGQMVRDIRMAGYDNDSSTSKIVIDHPITPGSNQLSISYEYDDTTEYTVIYRLNGGDLVRQLTVTKDMGAPTALNETLLEGVNSLSFIYGLDTNNDGVADSWVSASGVTSKVIAIRVQISAHPLDSDGKGLSPRELESVVTLRNRIL